MLDHLSWEMSVAIAALLTFTGGAIDKFLLKRQKVLLRDYLLRFWNKIKETKFPDLSSLMAELLLKAMRRVFGKRLLSKRGAFMCVLISASLTTLALLIPGGLSIGYFFEGFFGIKCIAVNLLFDIATVSITCFLMARLSRFGAITRIVIICLDALLAFLLAVSCLTLAVFWTDGDWEFQNFFMEMLNAYCNLGMSSDLDLPLEAFLYASTTLIPTFLYLSILLILVMSKPILETVHRLLVHFLELSTEDADRTVFLYTGVLLGFIGILFKLGLTIAKASNAT